MKKLILGLFLMVGTLAFSYQSRMVNITNREEAIYDWDTEIFWNTTNNVKIKLTFLTDNKNIVVLRNWDLEVQATVIITEDLSYWVITSPSLGYDVVIWIELPEGEQ
jgi:hypothetical protein